MSDLKPMRVYPDLAWDIASTWSDVLASDTRTLAAQIEDRVMVPLTAERDAAIARADAAKAELRTLRNTGVNLLSRAEKAEAEVKRLRKAIKLAYGELWRDARLHTGMVSTARRALLKALTSAEQRDAVEAAIARHGPVSDSEILELPDTRAALAKQQTKP